MVRLVRHGSAPTDSRDSRRRLARAPAGAAAVPPWRPRNAAPPTPPEVIVVDVEQAIEDARRVATEAAAASPDLAPLVEEGLAAAQAAVKAATASGRIRGRARPHRPRSARWQMQVAGRRVEIAVNRTARSSARRMRR